MIENQSRDQNALDAVAEIKAILAKRDLAGTVVVCSKTETHYLREWSPSWSAVKITEKHGVTEVRVRAKRADFASLAEHKEVVGNTISLILGTLHQLNRDVDGLTSLAKLLDERIVFVYGEAPHDRP